MVQHTSLSARLTSWLEESPSIAIALQAQAKRLAAYASSVNDLSAASLPPKLKNVAFASLGWATIFGGKPQLYMLLASFSTPSFASVLRMIAGDA
jgi:hypothetical protein